MSGVSEAVTAASQLGSVLRAGVEQISARQSIVFTKYVRVVLPLDGYVFWVNAAMVSPSAMPNTSVANSATPNAAALAGAPSTIAIEGSFHFEIARHQEETTTSDINRVVFTAENPIDAFDQISSSVLYLGTFDDGYNGPVRFAFSQRRNFFQQADLWHYVGDAVYPDMESQIIDTPAGFDQRNVVVSNSLPIWLALNAMTPPIYWPAAQQIPLYPSFLVPQDIVPPWGAVHIDETQALTSAPLIGQTLTHSQLVRDHVKITFYGARNFNAMDFIDYVNVMSEQDDAAFGVMNMPVMRDEKKTQSEMAVIAMKKSVVYDINYYQERVRDIARQLILHVIPSYSVGA